jgi:diguanylate cyclase (GGDEF)-like protein
MIYFLVKGLAYGSAIILVGSLFTTRRLMAHLPQGRVRKHWNAMLALIMIFLVGYLAFALAFRDGQTRLFDLIVPGIFFSGACFVWLTANLSLQTAADVMRISLLEHENISDPLTGIFNRRFLERRLSEEITRALRHDLPLSILLIDIDHFKLVNDRYGHRAGDLVLTSFAKLLENQLREPDILARYGGEEFMVIAPHTPHQNAVELAERLRMHVESNNFGLTISENQTLEIRLTCCIGVGSLSKELDSVEKLFQSVDENLYRAKYAGRNRVKASVEYGMS